METVKPSFEYLIDLARKIRGRLYLVLDGTS